MSILAVVYLLFLLGFGLLFLIDCFRFSRQINVYVKYGIACGLVLVAVDGAILLFIPKVLSLIPAYLWAALSLVTLVKITVFTCMGMHCCSILNVHDLPAVRLLFREAGKREKVFGLVLVVSVAATAGLAVGYSVVLFKLTSPHISELLKHLSGVQLARLGMGGTPFFVKALAVLGAAFSEEIVFRLGIQNYIARQFKLEGRKYWIAVVTATLIWSLGHAGVLEPEWVKIAQVFPMGLALGFLFRKYGTETCMLVHGLFNVIMILVSPSLIQT